MGEIYRGAAHVLACIGPHADDSEFLIQTCAVHHRRLLDDIYAQIFPQPDNLGLYNDRIYDTRLILRGLLSMMNATLKQRLMKSFFALLRRPYFTRVWILQEMHAAGGLSYHIGMHSLLCRSLLALSLLVCLWIRDNMRYSRSLIKRSHSLLALFSKTSISTAANREFRENYAVMYLQLGCLALADRIERPRKLAYVLSAIRDFQCADVRDKVYGIISLVDWQGWRPPVPDYSISHFDIAREVLTLILAMKERNEPAQFATAWASILCEVFDVAEAKETLGRAIQVRSRSSPMIRLEATTWASTAQNRYADESWMGVRISPSLEQQKDWENQVLGPPPSGEHRELRYSEIDPGLGLIRLVDDYGTLVAYAPRDTKPGDWFLICARPYRCDRGCDMGLIVRQGPEDDGRYTLIGPTSKFEGPSGVVYLVETCTFSLFTVWWHLEDLLMFGWMSATGPREERVRNEVAGSVNMRICGFEGSSYVVRKNG